MSALEGVTTDSPVSDLISFIGGAEEGVLGIDLSSEVPWGSGVAGVFKEPQQKADPNTGRVTWKAPWTRLAFADFNYLYFWDDPEEAREEARADIQPYVRGLEREELYEVKAPQTIEEAGVNAGDRGVVIEKFERPSPALLVEYADFLGQTKALVTYSTDLETILDVFVDQDFQANRELVTEQNETTEQNEMV